MDYKEKAKELLDKFYNVDVISADMMSSCNIDAKQCALIAVDEMLNEYPSQCPKDSYEMERHLFWQEVKNEILNYE